MKYSAAAIVAPLLAGQAAALGNAVIKNMCAEDVNFWEVLDQPGPQQTIPKGGTKTMSLSNKAGGGGVSYKITGAGGTITGPMTQFELTIDQGMGLIFWDISNVNGGGKPPFVEGGIIVSGGSMTKTCAAGQNPCDPHQGYTATDDNWATASSALNEDVTMELCGPNPGVSLSGGSGSSGSSGSSQQQSPSSSPSSSPSAAPSPTQAPSADNVNEKLAKQPSPSPSEVDVTVVVTVTAPAAVVTTHMAGQKRDGHIHNHAHAHNKFNKRRHGA